MVWKEWRKIVEKDWHYLVIIVLLLGLILYLTYQMANTHEYCMNMMESIGCFEIKYNNILGGMLK